ncbi:TPA: very short patch repair endonuclease [Burkholderia cenocepacia]|uniref:very short patch repair endonuclease n=1 Tax=Burkholderia cenocepacia TaxID=95486 RepID=UPI001B9666AB|nr:DNA mismatch endonuclease Vsr [Burkholderia cenocepacia]MBR8140309.1 DNA mismatch endonuclease Vsr [Burkholderia cenocepacia]
MVDIVDAVTRSRMMAGIRRQNTRPEIIVRQSLHAMGLRFRLHRRDLPGVPDIVLPGRRIAIFVHGCFWHMHSNCQLSKLPETRRDFWQAKLEANTRRDRRAVEALLSMGWRVLTVWECAVRTEEKATKLSEKLRQWIDGGDIIGEISGD